MGRKSDRDVSSERAFVATFRHRLTLIVGLESQWHLSRRVDLEVVVEGPYFYIRCP